jgi:thiomorpholine-carboxylate dehydrogenase
MTGKGPLFLDEEKVKQHLRMSDLIPAMEQALIDFSAGKVVQPVRSIIKVNPPGGFFGMMPALAEGLGIKLVTFYPPNAERGIPTHMAMILLFERDTGTPLAVMDGRLITEMRTAAVSAAATKFLSSPGARVLAILGSGVQARSHVEALRLVRPFDEIRISSRTPSHAEECAGEIGAKVAGSPQDAVSDADVVVTVTSSTTPVLKGEWLKQGCHINAIGACRPDWRELDDDVMRNVVFVDSRAAALQESGDVILSGAKIYAELGEMFAGRMDPRRGEITVFKSLGLAVEDVASALLVYRSVTGGKK